MYIQLKEEVFMNKKAEVPARLTGQELDIAQKIYTASFPKLVELMGNSGGIGMAASNMAAAIKAGLIDLREDLGNKL